MGKKAYYTKEEIIARFLEDPEAKAAADKRNLYKSEAVNYRSDEVGGQGRPATEVIAEWISEHFHEYLRGMYVSRRQMRRDGNVYRQLDANGADLHDGKVPDGDSPREEDRIAMTYKGRSFRSIGTVLDYQVPLKDSQADEMGKIDLVSYDLESNRLYLLELKRAASDETLLRCLLESFAYARSLDRHAFAREYGLPSDVHKLVLCPIYFDGSCLADERREMLAGTRPQLSKLVERIRNGTDYDVAFAKIVGDDIVFD